ncbi:MAG: type IX secretion system membrane protein PorP/SprF [Pedobacter sp.]|nr:MAG: type IX secretion system membrane protein PorP/SprF [Pedobacter sp.]
MKKLTYTRSWSKIVLTFLAIMFCLINGNKAVAQLKPANAIYYFNEFLINPSIAGREEVLKASIGYRQQLSSFNGAPQNQFLAVDYGFDSKSGIGLKINNDKAGLLRQTSISATYAYHLPLNELDRLSFGISASFTNDRLNESIINGDPNDPDVADVNQRKAYVDSDFGMTYKGKALTIQAVFPNMVATIKNSRSTEANYALFFSSVSYSVETDLGLVEPKVVFRGIKGFKNIVDVGTNFQFKSTTKNQFNIMGLYHSSKNATVGFGINFNDRYAFNGSYTMATTQLQGYSTGDFEIGLGLKL